MNRPWFAPRGARLASRSRSAAGSLPRANPYHHQLRLEPLEDRRLLTAFLVNSLADIVAADGYVTLREALQAANANAAVFDAPAGSDSETDVITFAASASSGTITLDGTQLVITDDVEIQGAGSDQLVIDAHGQSRVFYIHASEGAILSGLKLTGGSPQGGDEYVDTPDGGAIYLDAGTLTITGLTIADNAAGTSDRGGGIYCQQATLTITRSTLSHNSARYGGAIYANEGAMTLIGCTIVDNSAVTAGGGVYSRNCVSTVANATFTGNSATTGGAIYYNDVGASVLSVVNSTIVDNSAYEYGSVCHLWDPLRLTNSILALNQETLHHDTSGPIASGSGFNLVDVWEEATPPGDNSVWGTHDAPLDAALTAIADLSGEVLYFRPQATSPAVDGGSDALAIMPDGSPLVTDVVGNPRTVGGAVDMGAVELSSLPELAVTPTPSVELPEGQSMVVRVALTAAPLSPVTVAIDKRPGDSESITSDCAWLEYDADNWDEPQIVTLSAAEDADRDRDLAMFTFSAVGMEDVRLSVSAPDNDPQKFIVTSLLDVVEDDEVVTLREALEAANTNTAVGDASEGCDGMPDIITFAPFLSGGTITLGGTQFTVTDDVEIQGLGADQLAIDANSHSRVFYLEQDIEVAISGLTLRGGVSPDVDPTAFPNIGGGAIHNRATLTIADSTISGNSARFGGGIFNRGTLTVMHSMISGNTGNYGGGGIYSSDATTTITDSCISDNKANDNGGGGGINNGNSTLRINGSTIANNTTSGHAGGILASFSEVEISNSLIADNSTLWDGGGIYELGGVLTITNSSIANNSTCFDGGAIFASGTVSIISSKITGNTANVDGGGIRCWDPTTIVNSTICGNVANRDGGGTCCWGPTTIVNSTICGNAASRDGGGAYFGSTVILTNSIIALNDAPSNPDVYGRSTVGSDFNLIGIWESTSLPGDNTARGTPDAPLDPMGTVIVDANGTTLYFRPSPDSPAVDAGSNDLAVDPEGHPLPLDVLGNARIYEGTVDMGAVELSATPQLYVTRTPGFEIVEGECVAVNVSLTAAPSSPVTVTIKKRADDSDEIVADRSVIEFDVTNWDVPQAVSISAIDDEDWSDDDVAVFSFSAAGMDVARVSVSTVDDDFHTYVVDSLDDVVAADGLITLREAIEAANTNATVGDASAGDAIKKDVITFDEGIFLEGGDLVSRTITLGGTQLEITDSLEIEGPGAELLTVRASGTSRVLHVGRGVEVTVSGLTITGGNVADVESSDAIARSGGGILNEGNLTVVGAAISDNGAKYGGGICDRGGMLTVTGSIVSGNVASDYGEGGGIASYSGVLSIAESVVSGNSSAGSGGGVYSTGTVTVAHSTLSGNSVAGSTVYGGGICFTYSSGTLTLTDSVLSDNSATASYKAYGGGVYAVCPTTLANSTISGNTASGVTVYGGGVYFSETGGKLTLAGSTVSGNTVSGSTVYGGAVYASGTRLTFTDSVFSENSATATSNAYGGGISFSGVLNVTGSMVSGNSMTATYSAYGGGLHGSGTLTLNVIGSTISGNSASGPQVYGGGICLSGSMGTLTLARSVLSGNSAAGTSYAYGGAIYNYGILTVTNSMLSDNASSGGSVGKGGAVFSNRGDKLSVRNSTIAGNRAQTAGGGIFISTIAGTVANSIVALNDAPSEPNVSGSLTPESGFNLIGTDPGFVRNPSAGADGVWGTGDDDPGDVRLRRDSAAINAGSNALAVDAEGSPLAVDLDGKPRIIYATVDIGAYEYALPGDASFDGLVDDVDASIVGAHWRQSGAGWGDGDFNRDGRVDDRDAAILAAHWGQTFVQEPPGVEGQSAGGWATTPVGRMIGPSRARLDAGPARRIEPLPGRQSSASREPVEAACRELAEAHAFAQFQRRIGPAKETRLSRPLVDLVMAGW